MTCGGTGERFGPVDSSAWVEVLRNRASPALRQRVEARLHEGRAALTAPIWVELYRGVRGKRELQQLNSLRSLCRWLDFDDDCWELSAQAARQCREQGATVPLGDGCSPVRDSMVWTLLSTINISR